MKKRILHIEYKIWIVNLLIDYNIHLTINLFTFKLIYLHYDTMLFFWLTMSLN